MMKRRVYWSSFFLLLCLAAPAYAIARESYFSMSEAKFDNLGPFSKWNDMVERFGEQRKVPDSECDKVRFHPCAIKDWKTLLESIRGKSFREQLNIVNDWGNHHPYVEDMVNWGVEDYWETPYEFMEISGDCEDYAIAKYYSLRALGFPIDQLRVIVVQDLNLGGIIHAVLGVYDDDDELLILDNQSPQVIPALRIYHYRPVYGINEDNWWAYSPK
ncbi:MAG: transglutaminase-like cysteine peptidase [Patescibacteria group bacterium]|nr:transglutaminase-like cysteine peptidase [Patescibacteria group bacterium]